MDNSSKPGDKSNPKEVKKRGRPKDSKLSDSKRRKPKTETKSKTKLPIKVNLDQHCGVPLTNSNGEATGGFCVRSLTCKSHSMGAKRSVIGRSKPYDLLLNAYHQRNNIKSATDAAIQQYRNSMEAEAEEDKFPTLTDAEEVSAVLRGAIMARPQPLDKAVLYSTRRRVNDMTMKELLYKSVAIVPPPPPAHINSAPPLAAVMASTEAILGKCILFNPLTNHQNLRPSQIQANTRMQNAFIERMKSKIAK